LVSEYAARQGGRFGGVVAISGGLIGDRVDRGRYAASLDGTPALFGCSVVDPYIPVERVHEPAAPYRETGAAVDERIYPGFTHSVNQDEVDRWQALLDDLSSGPLPWSRGPHRSRWPSRSAPRRRWRSRRPEERRCKPKRTCPSHAWSCLPAAS